MQLLFYSFNYYSIRYLIDEVEAARDDVDDGEEAGNGDSDELQGGCQKPGQRRVAGGERCPHYQLAIRQ